MSRKRNVAAVFIIFISGAFIGFLIGASATSTPTVLTGTITTSTVTVITQVASSEVTQPSGNLVEYCFSAPEEQTDCASVLIYWFGQANVSIHIMIYSFTLTDVANALIAAHNRGVDVKIAWDPTEVNIAGSQYQNLANAGISIRIDHEPGLSLLHDKVAIIDSRVIITGSFNWSNEANLHDRENLLVINSQAWGAAYEQNFQEIWAAST